MAVGIDVRSGKSLDELETVLEKIKYPGTKVEILFLDAEDKALVKRYKETRRSHPLAGSGRVDEGIKKERGTAERPEAVCRLYPGYQPNFSQGSFGKNWKKFLWKMLSSATLWSQYCPLALNTEFPRMRILSLTCASCQILTT